MDTVLPKRRSYSLYMLPSRENIIHWRSLIAVEAQIILITSSIEDYIADWIFIPYTKKSQVRLQLHVEVQLTFNVCC